MSIVRGLLLATVITFACSAFACGQSSSRRMVPAQSPKDLVLEGGPQEGIVQVTISQLFKEGETDYAAIDIKTLPPLPTGFVQFRDQAYRLTTEAMVSGEHTIIFHVPSVENEAEFKRLQVLYLAEDELSPVGKSWVVVTVVPGGWDGNINRSISKATYERFLPDFSSRRIAAITDEFGIFAIAIAPEIFEDPKEPFTRMELVATSVPETALKNEQITHTFLIKNNGPIKAEEVNFQEWLNSAFHFESATATQGRCHQSNRSSDKIVCHLGPMAPGASATIRINARVGKNENFSRDLEQTRSIALLLFKQAPADLIAEKNQLMIEVRTAIVKDP